MGKRVYKKCISIFLVVCMLVSITPASTCQVKAAGSINIMDITEKAGVFVRGGMNAYEQAKQFTLATEVNALAITKLDGTAKGGVVIGISDQFKIPVKYIGIGEKIDDLQVFNREEFVDSLFN